MPDIRPFRALRYSSEAVRDLSLVVAPPYDVIGPEEHRRLLARDPRNVVRLDLPLSEAGEDPDERYRRAARTLSAWRSDGTVRRDPRPSIYVYEQAFSLPGSAALQTRRGFFARIRLEPFGPGSGIRPHERTLAAPREDRYRLLRATNVNTSPIVAVYDDPSGRAAALLDATSAARPSIDVVDDDGVRNRVWTLEANATSGVAVESSHDAADSVGAGGGTGAIAAELCRLAATSALTIADGHHRYETALRYRDERRVGAPADADAAADFVLGLLVEPIAGPLSILATHRIVLGETATDDLPERAGGLFEIRTGVGRDELVATFGPGSGARGGEGRIGLWTRSGGAILRARREAFDPFLPDGEALRRLDVTLAGVALDRLFGIDAAATTSGRLAFTKDPAEAIGAVDRGRDGAAAALLLDPTPAGEMVAVAADGDVMPQKSTYIYPKALTGLVINPLEW